MRYLVMALWVLCCWAGPANAQVSVSIGINLPVYPQLVRVPDYPVYYAPQLQSNYFFYDGMYWVYQGDTWYASSWYNGPWAFVGPEQVPLYVLRIPVRYYRSPPPYFRGWQRDAPPRWGDHWGRDWEQHRSGWNQWNRRAAPAPAPLPSYQRKYNGERYPNGDRQHDIQGQNYRYQPRDPVVRQHFEQQQPPRAAAPQPQPPRERAPVLREKHTMPQDAPQARPVPRAAPPQEHAAPQEPRRGQGREKDRDNDRERGDRGDPRGPDRNNRP